MIYNLAFHNKLTNTAFALVGSGLISGHKGGWYPSGFGSANEISPKINYSLLEFLYTTGDGRAEGFIRLHPTLERKAVPPSVPDSEILYIGWNIPGSGAATYTLTAPSLYKLTNVAEMSFEVIGAFGLDTRQGDTFRARHMRAITSACPATRQQAATDNALAASRVDPHGASEPQSCVAGYVWHEARPGDEVCVTLAARVQTAADNAPVKSRVL
jgi:hypothetical protein